MSAFDEVFKLCAVFVSHLDLWGNLLKTFYTPLKKASRSLIFFKYLGIVANSTLEPMIIHCTNFNLVIIGPLLSTMVTNILSACGIGDTYLHSLDSAWTSVSLGRAERAPH